MKSKVTIQQLPTTHPLPTFLTFAPENCSRHKEGKLSKLMNTLNRIRRLPVYTKFIDLMIVNIYM